MKQNEGMNIFKFVAINGIKKTITRKYIIVFIVVALILQGFLQVGKLKYFDNQENMMSLQKFENSKVENFVIYRQYAGYGITLMFIPSAFSILYHNADYEMLIANVNISFINNIYSPMKGSKIHTKISSIANYMNFFLFIIFIISILYGMDTVSNISYNRFLSSNSSKRKVFWSIVIFRLFLLNAAFLLLIFVDIAVLLIDKINLFRLELLPILWVSILVANFSYAIGCVFGRIKGKFKKLFVALLIFFIAVILLPLMFTLYTQVKARNIEPIFETDNENLITVMLEEEKLIKKHGVLPPGETPTEEIIKDTRKSIANEANIINEREERLKRQHEKYFKESRRISTYFPIFFYFSICESISTNGGEGFIDFFTYSQQKKKEFIKYCVDKIYKMPVEKQKDKKEPEKVESFIKDNEDLFIAKSKLPQYFWLGSVLSILWIAVLLFIAYRRFLKQMEGETGEIRDFEVKMKSEDFNHLLTADKGLKSQVYNFLSGKGPTTITMTIDGEKLVPGKLIYAYDSEKFLQDIDKKVLYKELFRKEMTGDLSLWAILIQYADETDSFLLLDNFFKGIEVTVVEKIVEVIKESGIKHLYIGDDYYQAKHLENNLIFSLEDKSIPGVAEKVKVIFGKK